jgi:hypothetical protein
MFDLQISKTGFTRFVSRGVIVESNRTTTVDVTLQVDGNETLVVVNAATEELLLKDSPLRGGNFQPQEVSRLPLDAHRAIGEAFLLAPLPIQLLHVCLARQRAKRCQNCCRRSVVEIAAPINDLLERCVGSRTDRYLFGNGKPPHYSASHGKLEEVLPSKGFHSFRRYRTTV